MLRSYELRHAWRSLSKNRAVSLITILVLAIGISANTAIFSVVNAVLLRPLPFTDPDTLVQIWHVPPAKSFPGFTKFAVSAANFLDWQSQNHGLEAMAAYHGSDFTLTGVGEPQPIAGAEVGPDFFHVLRANARIGRVLGPEDGKESAAPTVVISDSFWRTKLNANPNIVGQMLRLNDRPRTIVGVMPKGFLFPFGTPETQVWTCLQWDAKERAVRGNHNYAAIGRLKDGVSREQAQSELATISRHLEEQYPADDAGWGAKLVPLREELVGDVRPALLVLLGAVAFVLLIACANVMNLILTATLARRKEFAIRTAVGAGRSDLVRQILTEAVMMSVLGGVLGVVLARFGVHLIVNFLSEDLPRMHEIAIDGTVLLFTLGLSIVAGLLAGLLPAWRFAHHDLNDALKRGSTRTGSDSVGNRTRNLLVVVETSLCLVLMVGAGLMVRTFSHLQKLNIGVDSTNVQTAYVSLPETRYKNQEQRGAFYERALEHIKALPGVESASVVDSLPLTGGSTQPIMIEGRPVLQMADQPEVPVRRIGRDYLRTMHIPLLRGRTFHQGDAAGRTPVILITESLAREFFPNEDPIGKHITMELTDKFFELPPTPREIVGIVGDVKLGSPTDERPGSAVYLPFEQTATAHLTFVVRTRLAPANVVASIAGAIHSVDPSLALVDLSTMDEVMASSVAQQRFTMMLLVAFAGVALALAAVGIYGVLSYAVRRRTKEIGIRMALGATVSDVVRMVIVDGLKPSLLGIGVGFAGAIALGRVLTSVIYGVSARDSLTLGSVAALLVFVALVASSVPAYRAAQVEPVKTLREE